MLDTPGTKTAEENRPFDTAEINFVSNNIILSRLTRIFGGNWRNSFYPMFCKFFENVSI